MTETTNYECKMVFKSEGDNPAVTLAYEYNVDFDENYEGIVPASYLAMRDTAILLDKALKFKHKQDQNESNLKADKAKSVLDIGDGLTENNSSSDVTD